MHHSKARALARILAVVLAACGSAAAQEIVFHNGKVWNETHPDATALVVTGDRITFVGDTPAALDRVGKSAWRIDLRGRRLLPGLIDSHVHFLTGGDELLAPDLRSARTEEEFARRLGAAAARVPKGTWLTGGTWDHENWPGGRLPTREMLDRFVPDHPVFVSRLDGHMAVANSAAIKRGKVTANTPSPQGGEIVRRADGSPAGVFKDTAMILISRHVPRWTGAQRLRRALVALHHAASLGITGMHDMLDSYPVLSTYQDLAERGALTARITVYTPITSHQRWGTVRVRRGFGGPFLRLGGLKGFADGSLGSTTAWFFEPYADAKETCGLPMPALTAAGSMPDDLTGCTNLGLQVAIHAIGDRANRRMLDLFAAQGDAIRPLRPRIEHAQHIHPDDLARFQTLGVVASMQPYHAIDDGRWAEKRIGAERCETTYAFRDLLERGAHLAFGSDWPVAPLSPWLGMYGAVTRRTLDDKHPEGWIPRQKISVNAALAAYTTGAARAGFAEELVGSLTVGKLADMIVVDRDPLSIPGPELCDVKVDLTMVGGRIVFERPNPRAVALRPEIVARADWAGRLPHHHKMHPHRIERITLHHSGVDVPKWPEIDGPAWMHHLLRFSLDDRPWGDVPYHFSVAPDGTIYAGRAWRYAGDTNTEYDPAGHLLIEAVGHFSKHDVPDAQFTAIAKLCAWATVRFGTSIDTIGGHRDHAKTSCPGSRLYAHLASGRLEEAVRTLLR